MDLPRLVIFDMAGTTVLDRGEVPAAFTAALADEGITVTADQVNAVRGASKRQAIRSLIPAGSDQTARAERAYAAFKRHLANRYSQGVQSVAGAAETFAWLRHRSVCVALNTGFDREITQLLLAALNWDKNTVDAVVCGDEVTRGRPAPQLIFHCMEATAVDDVRQVAVVGDTSLDLQAAHNAAAGWNIGVLSGAHSREQLEKAPHTHLLGSVADLPSLWQDAATASNK